MRLNRLLGVAALAIVIAGALSGAALAASQTVVIQSFTFMPPTATINVGESVTWQNHDPLTHTATSDSGAFDTGQVAAGGSKTVAFAVAGSYAYHCAIHPTMKGTIVVLGPAPAPSTPAPSTPRPTAPPTTPPTAPPTAAPTTPPTAAPTAPPTESPSPPPSATASPSPSASPTPSPTIATPVPVPSAVAAASPTSSGGSGPAPGTAPGPLIAAGGLALAAALGGLALYLYRRR